MTSFWNKGEKDIIKGLDILGVRSIDQYIETQLLASITTISIRARYLSLIPWIVGEFFDPLKDEHELDSDEIRQNLMQVFDRLELVIILSTIHEKSKDPKVLDTGIIGREVHAEIVKEFEENGGINKVILKEKAKKPYYTNPTYGTYYNPCRGFGLLTQKSGVPVAITKDGYGDRIYLARKAVVSRESDILKWLLHGGVLDADMIAKESELFSISHIASVPQELVLLQEAFLIPFDSSNPSVIESYNKFNDTLQWTLKQLVNAKRPQELIYDNYTYCISARVDDLNDIELNWFEFELRRRVHFSLELLLKALSFTLDELNGAKVERVMESWLIDIELSNNFRNGAGSFNISLKEYQDRLEDDIFFDATPVDSSEQALYAISLLEVCRLQSVYLLDGVTEVEGIDYMRKTFSILQDKKESKVYEALIEVLKYCVVEPHLKTTLRKMGQDQQCSLRFFPEGQKLVPTGIDTNAGVSGSRLNNAMRMISDIGLCDSVEGGEFIKNEMSEDVIARLGEVS